jgi:serine/threonine-protein kinase
LNGAWVPADLGPDFTTSQPGTVVETLSATIGPLPRDVPPDFASGVSAPTDRSGRYQLFGEIGRGGMGTILRGRDPSLGRELAVKVLLDGHKDRPELVRRFVEEAQIGGQLQHPGIVPVYELGAFSDSRPYFTMKLVKGRTLAELLRTRKDPAEDRPRFLSIFEAIAQTVAYAHARGVIHRDLKPSNVMVGSFGEVQVMDWGLAKVLERVDVTGEDEADPGAGTVSVVRTERAGSDADVSQAGTVLGTPAYMSPEQASGDLDLVDERADVFGLGAILCEVLTGAPPYCGRTAAEAMSQSARGDTADACRRLDACGADADLIALAQGCLASDPLDRPGNAGDVADRITAYLAGVQEKLHSAERDRAVAEARAVEESKRRRVTLALAASVVALVVIGGGGGAWYTRHRERQAAQVVLLTREANLLRDQARGHPDDPARWVAAREAVKRVEVALGDSPDPGDRKTVDAIRAEVQSGLAQAEADRTLLELLVDIRTASAEDRDGSATDAAYAAAFRAAGIDVDAVLPAEAGARIARRHKPVAQALVAALDHWTRMHIGQGAKASAWSRLVAVARAADPDRDRDALRAALLVTERAEALERLRPLVGRAGVESWAPASMVLLADTLGAAGDLDAAAAVLRQASGTHPGDDWVHYDLGRLLEHMRPPRTDEAIAAYMAARAVRPANAHGLAHALERHGRDQEGEAIFRDLTHRRPGNAQHLTCFGILLKKRGRETEAAAVLAQAVAAGREATRLRPGDALAHHYLGQALHFQRKLDEAIAEYTAALRITPNDPVIHNNLGNALYDQGKLDEAVAEHKEALRIAPNDSRSRNNLGNALRDQGKLDEAIAEHHEAIRLDPADANPRYSLGITLSAKGMSDAAVVEYRKAIQLNPAHAEAHCNLGLILLRQNGDYFEALELLRRGHALGSKRPNWKYPSAEWVGEAERAAANVADPQAIRLKREEAVNHYRLGYELQHQGKPEEAVAEYRKAIRLDSEYAEAHCNLGLILLRQIGEYAESLELLRRGHELGSKRATWKYPSAEWVHMAERSVALEAKLPALLKAEVQPADAAEGLGLGRICTMKHLHAAAARFYAGSFAADPTLADDVKSKNRYFAACAAALAGCGKGKDDPRPGTTEKAELRRQAREWLLADLAARCKVLDVGTVAAAGREDVRKALSLWKSDPDLACVRSPESVANLPEEEQELWRSLWSEVDARLTQARGDRP